MKRRFLAGLIVALAVLFSQSGGLVFAAICPHLRSQQPDNSCHSDSATVVTEHHQSDEAKSEALEVREPDVRCNHCVVHSRSKREETLLQQTNTPQRASDDKAALPVVKIELPLCFNAVAWSAKAKSPPGPAAPLYLLVNVFRI